MGQVLHGSATTTEAVRRAIQHSQASLRARFESPGPAQIPVWPPGDGTVKQPFLVRYGAMRPAKNVSGGTFGSGSEGVGEASRYQPEDRRQVEEAHVHC